MGVISFSLTTTNSVITRSSKAINQQDLGGLISQLKCIRTDINGIITEIVNSNEGGGSIEGDSDEDEDLDDENTTGTVGENGNTPKRCVSHNLIGPKKRLKT